MKISYCSFACWTLLFFGLPTAFGEDKPLPPEPKAIEKQKGLIRTLFAERYSAKSAEALQVLAWDILQLAEGATDPARLYAIFDEAAGLAAQAGDLKTALDALERQEERFQLASTLSRKSTLITQAASHAKEARQWRVIARHSLKLIEEAFQSEDPKVASDASRVATKAADSSGSPNWKALARAAATEAREYSSEHETARRARVTLAKDPLDPPATLALARFLCFAKADWQTGLPLLAKTEDFSLSALAEKELKDPRNGDEWRTLAEDWLKARDALLKKEGLARRRINERAAYWLGRALQELQSVERVQAERKWAELSERNVQWILGDSVLLLTFDGDGLRKEKGQQQVKDFSGHENHGVSSGAEPVPGMIGRALSFNGEKAFVKSAGQSKEFPAGNSPRTIAAWVKTKIPPGTTRHILCYGNADRDETHFFLSLEAGGGPLLGTSGKGHLPTGPRVDDDTWHHVAGVYEGGRTNALRIYVDGKETGTRTLEIKVDTDPRREWFLAEGPRRGKLYQGLIDEVLVVGRALSAEEVQLLTALGRMGRSLKL